MNIITLGKQDRDRFAAWLEQEAKSYEKKEKELNKSDSCSSPVAIMLNLKIIACTLITAQLRNIE